MRVGRLEVSGWGVAVLAAALLAVGISLPALAAGRDDGPRISAPHAILIAENGSVLYERDADVLIPPASLAKLMTAEYVFHQLKTGKIKLSDQYEVSEYAWRHGGAPSRTS
ncbi:MAG: serine hydrolase, partial [Pseudolabrys sp.]